MRVLVVAEARPAEGGVARFTEMLVEDPVLRRRVDFELLNTTRQAVRRGGQLSVENIRNAFADAVAVWRRARTVDLVHVQAPFMPMLPLLRALVLCQAARLAGAAVVCHVHTGLVDSGPHRPFRPAAPMRVALRRFRRVDRLVVLSDAARRGLSAYLPSDHVDRLDNAVNVDVPQSDPGAQDPPVLVYAGALGRSKGLLDLLAALVELRRCSNTHWVLEVYGGPNQLGGEEAARIREAYAAEGLAGAFRGAVPRDEVAAALARASVAVLPSHSEGQPLIVLEAMAAGLPVVVTAVGALGEVVRDGVDGLVVPPGDVGALADALDRLLSDEASRRSMGRRARRRVEERYGLDPWRRDVLALYDDVLTARRRGRCRAPSRRTGQR